MTSKDLYLKLGSIDPKMIEAAEPKENIKKTKRSLLIKWSTTAASFIFMIVTFIMINAFLFGDNSTKAGGTNGKINIVKEIIILEDEYRIDDNEAIAYLEEVKGSIVSSLNTSGVNVSELEIKEKGYSHVRTGDDGNTVAVNWRDYLAYDGEKLVAIIQVTKDKTGFKHYIMFGGEWFSRYELLLEQYKGVELAYIYIGDVDAFITPDNKVVSLIETDISSVLEENRQYYVYFITPYNVYTP